jgi:oxygen-independent coproporphyrinogen-3 oxidase
VIEALLCRGAAELPARLLGEVEDRLAPFTSRGLANLSGNRLQITHDGLPYARVIASLFDAYRAVTQRRFSSAI